VNLAIKQLQQLAAPELNFLLTEPPSLVDGEYDFGWFCREHAFCTVVIGALTGIKFKIVRGDFLIRTAAGFRLSSLGAASDHAWCQTDSTPITDFSLHFRQFPPGPQIADPIIQLGCNGVFDVRILPATTDPFSDFGNETFIGYIPRDVFHKSAREWIDAPLPFLRYDESAAISMRVALHIFSFVSGKSQPLAGTMTQLAALKHLRQTYQDARHDLQKLLENAV
jgi:hypothetical protein